MMQMGWWCWIADMFWKWEAVTAIATVAAAGIIFWQLKTLNKQIKLQQYADYTKRYQEIVLNFPENINDPNFKFGKSGTDKYDRTMRYMRSYFDLCFEEWDLNERKLIDNETWNVWNGGIRTAMKKSAFEQAWKIALDTGTEYGPDFCKFMEDNAVN